MARRQYTPEDMAAVNVALRVHDGNIVRASKETGVPEQTIRNWKQKWEKSGIPSEVQEVTEKVADDIVESFENVRALAVEQLTAALRRGEVKPRELATIIGILDDKIVRAKGLATSRQEVVHTLPDAKVAREIMQAMVRGAIEGAAQREQEILEADIIDVEVVEQAPKALPASGR
ncbi:MAG TPA: hypothetical protein VFY54_17040 [Rubrobacter sp.]|nr:hypothetical protein [Rubrobacter sp.]